MTIKREDVDRRIVDFSDIASGRRLRLMGLSQQLIKAPRNSNRG